MMAGFFGDRATQRFRIYHAPDGAHSRPRAVLLCYPGPQEYRQTHWMYKQLAVRLANAGLHVMRFDYLGTGDSAGAAEDGSLDQWTTDVMEAAEELRALAGVSRLAVVGMRLGAALAVRAVVRGLRTHDLVLWDPVVSGAEYLDRLTSVHHRLRLDQPYPISDRDEPNELLGIRTTASMRAHTRAIDLLVEPLGTPDLVWTVVGEPQASAEALASRWAALGTAARYEVIADATLAQQLWTDDTLIPRAIPQAIIARLSGSTS
jgi:uncharacterized protein